MTAFPWTRATSPVWQQSDWPFRKLGRGKTCPICGHHGWCMIWTEEALCMRVLDGATRTVNMSHGTGGVHRLTTDQSPREILPLAIPRPAPVLDFAAMHSRWYDSTDQRKIPGLEKALSVTVRALQALAVVRAPRRLAWAFPMRNADGLIIGLRLRYDDGRKITVAYSRTGCFYGTVQVGKPLLICEGPTDAAAAMGRTENVIGRPSCSGGNDIIIAMVKHLQPPSIIIVGDNDEPGRRGAEHLCGLLPQSHTLYPPAPHKDLRAWLKAEPNARFTP